MAMLIPAEMLLRAYRAGVFPMAMETGDIRWFSPDPRGILPLDQFRIPHGARREVRDPAWEVSIDRAFGDVMQACADRSETWIDETIYRSYVRLFDLGYGHSVEVRREGQLVGGLYGVAIGGAFFGESMFHRQPGASKVALVRLVEILRNGGFQLLDLQWTTPHLRLFGAVDIPRRKYERLLQSALGMNAKFELSESAELQ